MDSRNIKLTQSAVDAAKTAEKRYALHDTVIVGFRLYVLPSGRKTYHYRYRVGGGRGATIREPKIGDAKSMKAEKARAIARDWQAEVAKGGDPGGERQAKRQAPRMTDLFDRFLADHARPHKKASSVRNDERLISSRLQDALGRRKVEEVTRADIDGLHKALASLPYEANRCLALLSKAFNLAEVWGWRADGTNPCRHVRKYAEKKRKRFLSPAELSRLGEVLRTAEHDGCLTFPARNQAFPGSRTVPIIPSAVTAVRLLILSGARKSEILGLHWDWIDFDGRRINLPDSKTGEKSIPLNAPALEVLANTPRVDGNPHVIVGRKPGAALVNLKDPWGAIRAAAGLEDVRIHDLRHSFAAVGAGGGASLPIIGALLGHTQPSTTQRYAHLADDPLRAASDAIGAKISAAMDERENSITVVPLSGERDGRTS
ncbi:MAG: site-specific integrase [Pseudomonadota bacterium]